MQPVRVLLIGDSVNLMRRLRFRLEAQGYEVTLGSAAPSPGFSLSRVCPDVLVADLSRAQARMEIWRRAVVAFRARRPLAVLFVGAELLGTAERALAEEIADLGLVRKPHRTRKVVERLDSWHESENQILMAG